jgi:hypothetical protein
MLTIFVVLITGFIFRAPVHAVDKIRIGYPVPTTSRKVFVIPGHR